MNEREKKRKKPGDGGDPEKWCRGGGMRGRSGGGGKKKESNGGREKREREREEGRGEGKRGKAQRASVGAKRNGRRHRWMDGMDGWDAPFPSLPFRSFNPELSFCVFWVGENCCGLKLTVLLAKTFLL